MAASRGEAARPRGGGVAGWRRGRVEAEAGAAAHTGAAVAAAWDRGGDGGGWWWRRWGVAAAAAMGIATAAHRLGLGS